MSLAAISLGPLETNYRATETALKGGDGGGVCAREVHTSVSSSPSSLFPMGDPLRQV